MLKLITTELPLGTVTGVFNTSRITKNGIPLLCTVLHPLYTPISFIVTSEPVVLSHTTFKDKPISSPLSSVIFTILELLYSNITLDKQFYIGLYLSIL